MERTTTTAQSNDLELEQMRQQMADLKSQLAEQEIVNDQLIRHTMKSRLSWINSYIIAETVAVPLLIIIFFLVNAFVFPLSPWLLALTVVMLLGNIIYDWRFCRVNDSSIFQGDLNNLHESLVWKKRRMMWEIIVSIIILAIWIPWLLVTMHDFTLTVDHDSYLYFFMRGAIYGAAIGAVIGLAGGLYLNWKIRQTYNNVIAQIDELLAE